MRTGDEDPAEQPPVVVPQGRTIERLGLMKRISVAIPTTLVAGTILLFGLTTPLAFALEKKTFVAYSMKVAQARVEEAKRKREDFRTKQPDLFYLGGITKPWAVVMDTKAGDWILVGERDPRSSVLTLDDWAVALRARFIHAENDPRVTIDPIPSETCLKAGTKEGCRDSTRQEVRFFGGIGDTHFGQVCYEADWLMKKVGLGLEKLPVEKLKTLYDLSVDRRIG
jgi:hypothetical protein